MFSTRTAWELVPNPLAQRVAARQAAGAALLDLTAANPTTCALPYPEAAIQAALADPGQMRYAPTPQGAAAARAAIAAYYHAHGAAVAPEQIVLTASTSEAYAWCFKLLADPGDAILGPQPSYPLFDYLAGLESVRLDSYPLRYDGEWHLDFPALAARIGSRTRAVIVVHPNNPTGSFLKRAEWTRLAALCREHGLAIIADEVFADYAAGPDPARMGTLAGPGPVLTFTLSGLSKLTGLPQLKASWLVVSGPPAAQAAALARLEVIADTYLSVGTPVQLALPRLLALGGDLRAAIRARVATNRQALAAALAGGALGALPAHALPAEGGWYAILRLPALRSEDEWALALLEQDDLLVQPGYFYDLPFAPALVLSLLPPLPIFTTGIMRLVARIRSIQSME